MLEANERHGEAFPLVVVVDGGSTRESTAGYDLLAAYGADRVVVDAGYPDEEVRDAVDAVVNPHLAGEVGRGAPDPEDPAESVTSAALAAELALLVRPEAREDLRHLPAASYRDPAPEAYADIAGAAGYEPDDLTRIREAVAVEAYYQSYEDKRELVEDVVFGDGEFATHLSEQYRERVETELETVRTNREYRDQDGVDFAVLDTEAYTHRFDFPPTRLLLDELHAEERADADDPLVTVGHGEDELRLRSTVPVDVRAVADRAADLAPDAAITVAGGRDGHLEFLVGEREAALDAAVEAVAAELSD
jgi:RecJ-like exonuclease